MGWKYRMDVSQEDERMSLIVDSESDWSWLLMPEKRMCSYFRRDDPENISSDPFLGLRFLESKHGKNLVGRADVSGYECDEYQIMESGRALMTFWESKDLGFPLKLVEHLTLETVTELSDIIEGEIDDTLFAIPDDYTILGQRWQP